MRRVSRLVLVGAGHGHLSVLRALSEITLSPATEVVLINPDLYQTYSGMLPGWMMGYYTLEQCQIRLEPWIKRAKLYFIQDQVIGLDANHQILKLKNHSDLDYDWLSINTGSQTQLGSWANDSVIPIRPLNDFIHAWQAIREKQPPVLTIIGGGAAGIELAFAAREALPETRICLVASHLLTGHSEGVINKTKSLLEQLNIQWYQSKVERLVGNRVELENQTQWNSDATIAATGAKAPDWLQNTGLALAPDGFIQVNAYQQSVSHPTVWAVGDISSRPDTQRSGVHAVKGGEVLAHNLVQLLTRYPARFQPYRPRKRSLYLLACGQHKAILSWGRFCLQGHWVWRWKNKIDTGFMRTWL
ncbi:FAD-dependent oxidoreductase [Thiofilum flexile]|uniref:FAD-dependent oxidoreductase n=1 Tax=Thiofilum flexile TaxID=125627 RepID=UPI000377659E|nr:FAD-dependent oxidoreductase [Thiofilum flexile]